MLSVIYQLYDPGLVSFWLRSSLYSFTKWRLSKNYVYVYMYIIYAYINNLTKNSYFWQDFFFVFFPSLVYARQMLACLWTISQPHKTYSNWSLYVYVCVCVCVYVLNFFLPLFIFLWYWGLYTGPQACLSSSLPLDPYS
jgi:hypothetical protein